MGKRRERGDSIKLYRILERMEKLDKEDLVITDTGNRKNGKELKMECLQKTT